jgi:Flp pilus assembly protein TadG
MNGRSRGALNRAESGQATVEFVLAFMIFMLSVIGVLDIGRLVFDEHGLTRATESIAHSLAVQYAQGTPRQPFVINAANVAVAIGQAHVQSDLGLDSTNLLDVTPTGVQYQVLSNPSISVCANPSFAAPYVVKVTIKANFNATLGISLGGRTVHLSQSSTALTYLAEQSAGNYTTTCP